MELVQPGLGLIVWMTVAFALLIWILGKFAWKPIMKGLKEREDSIDEALNQANKAREEMKELKFSNEQLLKEAKEERDNILRDARMVKESIIEEAREKGGILSIDLAAKQRAASRQHQDAVLPVQLCNIHRLTCSFAHR